MPTQPKSRTDAIAVVESFFERMEALDLPGALDLLAPDVVYQNVPFPADRGIEAVTRTLRSFSKVMTGFEVRMHNIAERDGVVLTERTDILVGPLLYLDIRVCGTFEVHDGKITLWRDYFDVGESIVKLLVGPIRRLAHR